jgi:two-component system CheB/CheR fusion protein
MTPDTNNPATPPFGTPAEVDAVHRAVLEACPDAIIAIDEDGTIRSTNTAAERMFGYPASGLTGLNVSALMPEPHRSAHAAYVRRYVTTGVPHIIGVGREVLALRRDGSTFPVMLSVAPVQLAGRRMFAGSLHDLTHRKRLEHELLTAVDRQQRRIGRDLHDGLGQTLTGIRFLAESLEWRLRSRGLTDLAEDATRIRDWAGTADVQTHDLARGVSPVDPSPSGLSEALEDLAIVASQMYAIECEFNCPAPVDVADPSAAAHAYRIAQEAVRNAARHAGPRTVTITLTAEGGHGHLTVSDDGGGFVPRPATGGLGLHIMRERAAIIGGNLTVRPREGGGTVVTCTFPLAPLPPQARGGGTHE